MERPLTHIHNAATGETITREMTDEEIEQLEKDRIANAALRAQMEADEAAAQAARESALAKLAALGLTEAEAAAIIK